MQRLVTSNKVMTYSYMVKCKDSDGGGPVVYRDIDFERQNCLKWIPPKYY
jgi:hypothetical protein